jgi:hypothetical protein
MRKKLAHCATNVVDEPAIAKDSSWHQACSGRARAAMPISKNDLASIGRARGRVAALKKIFNADVLDHESRTSIVTELSEVIGSQGRVRVRLDPIAFGNLKLMMPERRLTRPELQPRNRARRGGTDPVARIYRPFAGDMNISIHWLRLSRIRLRQPFAGLGLTSEGSNSSIPSISFLPAKPLGFRFI